jgi:hypothetical protein
MKTPLIASAPWTAEEDNQLRALAESGEPLAAIAERLARSPAAVRHRFYKLGIPLKRTRIAGPGGKQFANHYERQFMEYLRGRGWVEGKALPPSKALISSLLNKGWIERQDQGSNKEALYRMTDAGLVGLKAPVPTQQGWTKRK